MHNRKFVTCVIIIVLAGILFRLWNFTPALGNDDQRWVLSSQELGKPQTSGLRRVYYTRILWRSTLAIWGQVAGLSLTTTPWLMFGLSFVTTVMIALAGRVAFSPNVGLWAAAVYATHPIAFVYDVLTLPDGLAQALLATTLFLFLKFLQSERAIDLGFCGLVVGLSFHAKSYFILTALPIAVCILYKSGPFRTKIRQSILFSALVVAGLAAGPALYHWDAGDPLAMFAGISDYGEIILEREQGNTNVGMPRFARAAMHRFDYLKWLFVDMGFVSGFLALWGSAVMFIESRKSISCLLLSAMTTMFFLFLLLFPAKIHPFTFVEMQPRYLGILLPMIAIGSGISIANVLEELPVQSVRHGFLVLIMLGLASNVMVPNDLGNRTFNRSSRQQFDGIRYLLVHAQEEGISDLVFPDTKYREITPDGFYSLGPTISFYDVNDTVSARQVKDRLLDGSSSVLFVPRTGFNWPLAHALRRGEYQESLEIDESYQELIHWMKENGFSWDAVRVPNTVFMAWMSWAGLVSREQQLVGWTYRQAAGTTAENATIE